VSRTDDEYKNVFIEFDACYFGYPYVKSSLSLVGLSMKESEFLKQLGVMFIEAANDVKKLEENG
jgi:hypothetical protein